MIKVGNNVIVNNDNDAERYEASRLDSVVLTCGLKLNSTVTASSINDDGFTFCLQRSIETLGKRLLPPQEFNVKLSSPKYDLFGLLAVVTAMLLCDVDAKVFDIIEF